MANKNLSAAKKAKKDEFYTQYADIDREMQAYLDYDADVFRGKTILLPCDDPDWSNFTKFFAENFELFGLKKLISTSYAFNSKKILWQDCLPGLENKVSENVLKSANYDAKSDCEHGKIFILDEDTNKSGHIDIDDLKWEYLKGDGDFRSDEVKKLRDEADIIITNPPFSLFREFLAWIVEADKKFAIIGNQNAITYKDVFPLIKGNKMWLGATGFSNDMVFAVPNGTEVPEAYKQKAAKMGYVGDFTRMGNTCWFTNIEHGRRHTPLDLMSQADNVKYSKHKQVCGIGYCFYDNQSVIEVPYADAIPSDHKGVMGVPITFLDKYCPEQFEIVGVANHGKDNEYDLFAPKIDGREIFKRLLIRFRKPQGKEKKK